MEPNLAGTIRYPDGVKLIVAELPSLFGTQLGERVRDFCKKWGFALLWGMGKNGKESDLVLNRRLLDVPALSHSTVGHNLSVSAVSATAFAKAWDAANSSRAGTVPCA